MTLREIVYLILDELKLMSDDSSFNEEHIKFLVNRYRVALLNQQYSKDVRKPIPESNYQTINITLTDADDTECSYPENCLKSNEVVPNTLTSSMTKAYTTDVKNIRIAFVSRERFKFTGYNNWTKHIIYCTNIDGYLYLTSNDDSFIDLDKLKIRGIFEDVEAAAKLSGINYDDILDIEYPLEAGLIPLLIQSVVQELSPKTITPEDSYNNAADDKSNIANYISRNQKQNPR